MMNFLKNYIEPLKKIFQNKIEKSDIEELESDLEVIKSAFDNDLLDIEEYKNQLSIIKDRISELKKKQSYADALIFNNEGKLLLLRRSLTDDFYPNCWCLPGGKIENGESEADAIVREVSEETGLDVVVNAKLLDKKIQNGNIVYFYCIASTDFIEGSLILDQNEHISYCFVSKDQLEKLPLLLDLKQTILEILSEDFFNLNEISFINWYPINTNGTELSPYSNEEERIANSSPEKNQE